ncbi:MAG: HAD family hydrolase [Gemmatimonadota bacterium]|jgi:histidinol-phosphate phosphatase family protein|nr:HAD family hydrolase [Gemmatimonadota bacterium]
MAVPRPGVFLDRDGTIIEDLEYLHDPDAIRFLPGADRAVARLTEAGLPVVIVTNQSGIGRGYYSEAQYQSVRIRVEERLHEAGGEVLASYHCPHSPTQEPPCDCRKPAGGLFLRAARNHGLDLAHSFYVGDRLRDLEAGLLAGGRGFLIQPSEEPRPSGLPPTVVVVDSLTEAVRQILESQDNDG